MTKYVFITGGVVDSVGKTVVSASLASLLQARGHTVNLKKLDASTDFDGAMIAVSRSEEAFVTDDGSEVKFDLGDYERLTGTRTSSLNYLTLGQAFKNVLMNEKKGMYSGSNTGLHSYVTKEINNFIFAESEKYDFVICEVGGNINEKEIVKYIQSMHDIKSALPKEDVLLIHVLMLSRNVPYEDNLKNESIREVRKHGISPDIVVVRTSRKLDSKVRQQLASSCDVDEKYIIEAIDVPSVYLAPKVYHRAGLDEVVLESMNVNGASGIQDVWRDAIHRILNTKKDIDIGVIGTPVNPNSCKSVQEALQHGGMANQYSVNIKWIDPEALEKEGTKLLSTVSGIMIPGGFGTKGMDGRLLAAKYARENRIPFFGVCFGFQFACIEALQNYGMKDATSEEFGLDGTHVIHSIAYVDDAYEHAHENKRPPLRIGATKITLEPESKIAKAYGSTHISERHRHRFTFNKKHVLELQKAGLSVVGKTHDGRFIEAVECNSHPWFIAVQFHPELKSTPLNPHPLFEDFVRSAGHWHELNMTMTMK